VFNRFTRVTRDQNVVYGLLMWDPDDPAVCAVLCVLASMGVCGRFGKGAMTVVNGCLVSGGAPGPCQLAVDTADSLFNLMTSGVPLDQAGFPFYLARGVLSDGMACKCREPTLVCCMQVQDTVCKFPGWAVAAVLAPQAPHTVEHTGLTFPQTETDGGSTSGSKLGEHTDTNTQPHIASVKPSSIDHLARD
jgi:hypothetical protein